jgi:hypothetical protein
VEQRGAYLKAPSFLQTGSRSLLFFQQTLDSLPIVNSPVYSTSKPKQQPPYKHNDTTFYKTPTHSTQQHHIMSPPPRPTGIWPSDGEIYQGTLEGIARDIGKPIYEVETVLSIGLQMGKAGLTKKSGVWIYNLNSTFIPDIIAKYDELHGPSTTPPRDARLERFGYY